jgi:hypothetical protein
LIGAATVGAKRAGRDRARARRQTRV